MDVDEGLAPTVRDGIWACLAALRAGGQSILIVDKHLAKLQRLCDRFYVLEKGAVVWRGSAAEAERDRQRVAGYLAV